VNRLIVAAVAVVLSVAVLAAPAAALTPTQRIAKLEKRLAALEKKNKTLTKQVSETRDGVGAVLAFGVCTAAITADAFQSTWTILNQLPGHTTIGTSSPVGDASACSRLQVSRPAQVPPTIGPFEQLMRLITASNAARLSFSVFS
jgi:hypothetical protein